MGADMGDIRAIRAMLKCVYGAGQQGAFKTTFQADENGRVRLLEIAGKWLDDLEQEKRPEFINRKKSGVILHAESDAEYWLADRQRKLGRYIFDNLSDASLSLLARAVLDELILARYDQLTERDKELARDAEETNMLFRSRKRVIVMAERILSSEGHNLTGPDVEVLQNAISLEIESARRRFEVEQDTETEEPTTGQEFIGWRGTPEQLEQLADELQKEKFVASAEAFAGQFKDAGGAVDGPCRWLKTDRSLVHLLEKLLNKRMIPGEANIVKEAIAHFLKENGSKFSDSLSKNRSNAKGSTNSRGFKTIDKVISGVFQ